jgi:hypothetical protein
MPRNDRDVWLAIVSGDSGQDELHYLAYAIYSFEKYEWYNQIEKQAGNPPTAAEIDVWIAQITEIRIKGWRENAARLFDVAARAYMKDQVARERQDNIDKSILLYVKSSLDTYDVEFKKSLDETRKSSAFGRQLMVGLLSGLLSPIMLGLIILAIQAADLWPSATGLAHFFGSRPQETQNKSP